MFNLPNYVFLPMKWLAICMVIIVFANLIYFTTLSIFGLRKPKRDYKMVPDQKKFVFVVPAHNEEAVIGPTIKSLVNQNYDPDLFDIVVIADNCTDRTIDVIHSYPRATAFENVSGPEDPRGKPHAIARYVETNHWKNYDYIAFIDADNIVDANYLREMNAQVITHPELTVVQGYLGIKNVRSSITASGYAAVYFITNRAVQAANYLLGWNAAIGGTGFILDTNYLAEHGWNPRSYTEDFELQVELSIAGKRSGWNHFAVVHDEKPDSLIASHNQRTRWAQGHWYVAFTTTWRQILSLFKSKSITEFLSKVETLFYSYSMVRPVAMLGILLLSLIDKRIFDYLPNLFSLLTFWVGIEVLNFLIIPIVYFSQEAKEYFADEKGIIRKLIFFIRLVIAFIYNSITYMAAQLVGFCTWFKPQNKWNKTVHKATFDRNEEEVPE
ncbi:glycosyltransferase family 2 protein [Candidatus Enterococcus courvalinii]|uniref:Glycosyltransferase family 2 protein n=1 Tax=Candidatus Enterococcus courvalinii TaxID=2815329 RepID=A0ABS3I2S8_9ENTE|nr:glycosyltransferase family 2 protein [Enterococcus sp. MSG2901]MBO0483020.1 glycosyltransferase family 2 protein [Enterococcus sp. MSG2901]